MIQMTVGDQDAVQAFEANSRLQDLPLSSFSAINQEPVFVVLDDLGSQATVNGGC
jgi:hypothetical protein